jgi:putative transposase
MVALIEQARLAVDELIDVTGRAALEAVLHLSAEGVAGAKHPGKAGGAIRWHGRQPGVVPLSNRKLRVTKPRLRRKAGGEVEVPAYAGGGREGTAGAADQRLETKCAEQCNLA